MKIMCVKNGGMFFPIDDDAKKAFGKIAQGELVFCDYKKNRSIEQHRRYFKFVSETFLHQDIFENAEIWRKYLQCMAGHYDTQLMPDGKTFYVPRSIAWDELDEPEFLLLFGEAVDAYIVWYEKNYGAMGQDYQMRIMRFL